MTDTIAPAAGPTVKEQGGALLAHAAGYASHRSIAIGLRSGLPAELDRAPDGPPPSSWPSAWAMFGLFEAQIDDQLLPRATYDDLLARHGFTDPGSAAITPMHAITWARRPAS